MGDDDGQWCKDRGRRRMIHPKRCNRGCRNICECRQEQDNCGQIDGVFLHESVSLLIAVPDAFERHEFVYA